MFFPTVEIKVWQKKTAGSAGGWLMSSERFGYVQISRPPLKRENQK
jgi:hypothetical protein